MNLLDKIIRYKRREVEEKKKNHPLRDIDNRFFTPDRIFERSIVHHKGGNVAVIAEVKLASPIKGDLGQKDEIVQRAIEYKESGADAISVVVDRKFFKGEMEFIKKIKSAVQRPVLAKDFVIDPYQILELKEGGADAVLLIARIVTHDKLVRLVKLVEKLGMEAVVEVDNKNDLMRLLQTSARMIAVNARNLGDFRIDIKNACTLIRQIPKHKMALGFSGVKSRGEVEMYQHAGAKGVLVGTSLMQANNIEKFMEELKGL